MASENLEVWSDDAPTPQIITVRHSLAVAGDILDATLVGSFHE
jgi:hypothetical protein